MIAVAEAVVEFGSDRCIATKDGSAYARHDNGVLPVVRLLDPFRRVRARVSERDIPDATRHLNTLVQVVVEHTTFEGRTHKLSAERSVVVEALQAAGVVEPREADAVIRLARNLGLLERAEWSRRLRVSNAGRVWAKGLLDTVSAPDAFPVGESVRAEVHDVATEMLAEGGYRSETMTPDRFREWTGSLIDSFKRVVETTAACDALWTRSGDPQDERAVQGFAHGVFHAYCEVADVDMSKEVDAGDGPVDFKFSQGWSSRALIEIKLLSNSRLSHGALSQLPAYLNAEGVSCGFYLCIGFTDADLAEKRKARVIVDCAAASERTGYEITPIFVDARRRPPASRRPG
ncbi:MAG: hypothetical protein KF680_11810 [Cryobacterium sp.]|nr:hypothetical protein [Cryobacterium sp.]